MKFYQHLIKFSHVSPGFNHHFFLVSTSFAERAGACDLVSHKAGMCTLNMQAGKHKGLQEQFHYERL